MDLAAVRDALADAVSAGGITCLPYEPDNPMPPIAFIDTLTLDYASPVSYRLPSTGTAVVIACGQRHDRAGSVALLESMVGAVVEALLDLPGAKITGIASGTTEIGRAELPAVSYTVQFPTPA